MHDLLISEDFFQKTSYYILLLNEKKQVHKVNPSFCNITGYEGKSVLTKDISFLWSDKNDKQKQKKIWKSVDEKGIWEDEVWIRKKNGELFLSKRSIFLNEKSDNTIQYILIGKDVQDEKSILDEKNGHYYHDFITGLPQTFIFREILASLIKEANRKRKKLAVLLLDFVSFKHINESFGYTVGDNFLNIASERLKQSVGEDALMTRMGGDIFAIVLKDISTEKNVLSVVEKIIHNFKTQPFIFSGQEIYLSTNIGISLYPTDGKNDQDLFKAADLARYRAKENGKGNYQFYLPSLNARLFERLVLETNLRKAIEAEQLVLFYQPQINISNGEVEGVEALIRWNHSDLGIVPPSQFIPIAEETGLILPIGKWVVEEACRQISEWEKNQFEPVVVSVNLSAKQLENNLVQTIKNALNKYQVNPSFIELEITETAVMKDVENAVEMLEELESLGLRISIDDFGTGYSSLSYLAKLPIHALKIDRSFIQNVSKSIEDATIVSTVIAMAHKLNLEVVAEGVETKDDLLFLKERHCEKYQGFYFSPPVPKEDVEKYLKKKDA